MSTQTSTSILKFRTANVKRVLKALQMPLLAALIGSVLTSGLLLMGDIDPVAVYSALLKGSLGSVYAVTTTIRWTIPLIISGVAVALALRVGIFNAGIAGQIYIGGFIGAIVGFGVTLPMGIHAAVAIVAGGVGGALWAFIPAALKRYFNASEIVTSLMLWYIALGICDFAVRAFFKDPNSAAFLMSYKVSPTALLNSISPVGFVSPMLLVAIFVAVAGSYVLVNSKAGYEIRITGANPVFAYYAGINTGYRMIVVFCTSGFLGGLIGASESIGINHRFISKFDPGFGLDGFLVALLANGNLIGCIPAGLFLGILKAGSLEVERTLGVSKSIIWIFQGTVILFVSAYKLRSWISILFMRRREGRC